MKINEIIKKSRGFLKGQNVHVVSLVSHFFMSLFKFSLGKEPLSEQNETE